MQYRSDFPLVRAATASLLALTLSVPAHAVILNAPTGPSAERVDAGIDQTASFARHGNTRGGYTQLTGLSDFRVRVNTSPAAPVVVDLGASAVQPIALRSPVLDKAAALKPIQPAPLDNVLSFTSSTIDPIAPTPAAIVPVADEQPDTTESADDSENQGPQVTLTVTEPVDVPEPGPLALLAMGLAVMLRRRRT